MKIILQKKKDKNNSHNLTQENLLKIVSSDIPTLTEVKKANGNI